MHAFRAFGRFFRRSLAFALLAAVSFGTLEGCSSRPKPKYKKRQQKKGKPMPCPQKDC